MRQHAPHNGGRKGAHTAKQPLLLHPTSIPSTRPASKYCTRVYNAQYACTSNASVLRKLQPARPHGAAAGSLHEQPLQSADAQARLSLLHSVSHQVFSQRPGRLRLAAPPSASSAPAQTRPQRAGPRCRAPGQTRQPRRPRSLDTRAEPGRAAGRPAARALTPAARAGSAGSGGPARGGPRAAPSSPRPRTRPGRPGRRRAGSARGAVPVALCDVLGQCVRAAYQRPRGVCAAHAHACGMCALQRAPDAGASSCFHRPADSVAGLQPSIPHHVGMIEQMRPARELARQAPAEAA